MTTMLAIYFVLLLFSGLYLGINIAHLLRFRLGFPGDKTRVAIAIYIFAFAAIVALSWAFGLFFSGI